jgi:probable O-glycosylation ligase (exosortase A-associated)
MRDVALVLIVAWIAGKAVVHPWIGIMGWTWVSMMNPHRLAYGFAATMPIAAIVGGATLIGLFLTRDRRDVKLKPETAMLVALTLWFCVTLPFSMLLEPSMPMWNRVMKTNLMLLVTAALLHSRKQIETFVWVVAGSLAFYGVKGGIFTIAKGGNHKVWGPEESYIEGNNEIALALIIIIPLLRYLHLVVEGKWMRRGLMASMVLCAAAALGSHSRGALLALGAMAFVLWWRSERKGAAGIILLACALLLIPFMPEEWTSRMSTIRSYDKDESAMGRINAWWMAWNLASRNFFGGGFFIWTRPIFEVYAPVRDDVHAAHSIYFQMLGEHGFIGLLLFMTLWLLTWIKAGKLMKAGRARPETMWVSHLGAMCQVSMVGYAVGGAFLSLAYFDLPYNVMVMVVVAARWLEKREWLNERTELPRTAQPVGGA